MDEVRLPGALGEMGVLPGHIPLLTSLAAGPLVARAQVAGRVVRGPLLRRRGLLAPLPRPLGAVRRHQNPIAGQGV